MPQIGDIQNAKYAGKSGTARYIYTKCIKCGKERWVDASRYLKGQRQLCQSCSVRESHPPNLAGGQHWNWKGGKYYKNGYVYLWISKNDFYYPTAQIARGYILEHRLVMARHLGRNLYKWEIVHHKNGIKDDNRIENLELLLNGQHSKDHSQGYTDGYQKGYIEGYQEGLVHGKYAYNRR